MFQPKNDEIIHSELALDTTIDHPTNYIIKGFICKQHLLLMLIARNCLDDIMCRGLSPSTCLILESPLIRSVFLKID